MRIKEYLKTMCMIPALSGHEQKMAAYMKSEFERLGYPTEIDTMGNCVAVAEGTDSSLPSVMVFGHMDQIGLVVRLIEPDGFIRVERLGGVPEKVLPAAEVQIQCRDGSMVDGVVGMKSHHITPAEQKYVVEKYMSLFIDIGAKSKEEVKALGIDIGSPVVYAPKFKELCNGRVTATSVDNRVACSILLELACRLKEKPVKNTVYLVGSVQEEYNVRGAVLPARSLKPDLAICIDIALEGGTPDMRGINDVHLGNGPVISLFNFHGRGTLNGTIPHPGMVKLFEDTAAENDINLQRYASIGILTDLSYVQVIGEGIKGIDVGVPCRYTHTPSELCSIDDLAQTAQLIELVLDGLADAEIER